MIIGAVFVHSFTDRLILKSESFPLRLLLIRVLEFTGKVCIIPGVFAYFVIAFPSFASPDILIPSFVAMAMLFALVAFREIVGFKSSRKHAILLIRRKIESPASHTLTSAELVYFNWVMFSKVSNSPVHYHQWVRNAKKEEEMAAATAATDAAANTVRSGGLDGGVQMVQSDFNGRLPRRSISTPTGGQNPITQGNRFSSSLEGHEI